MKLSDLKYEYPEELVATQPVRPSRVMFVGENEDQPPIEIAKRQLLEKIEPGDVLTINNTKVLKRRVFAKNESEILFLDFLTPQEILELSLGIEIKDDVIHENKKKFWKVLFPSKKLKVFEKVELPNGFVMTLLQKGRPQIVKIEPAITESDFEKIAELPLPPYIQKARDQRHNVTEDESWYQTAWAQKAGSMAAPTASLHFDNSDLELLRSNGVKVIELTLHVGLGTFLPVSVEDLDQHKMHSEQYEISTENWETILSAKKSGKKVWALGTTTTRVLESVARTGKLFGDTDILLQVGSEFKVVDRLLTNFHQPESTLLALVAGFSGLERVRSAYSWAIEKKFRLFSYGDLSVWFKA